MIDSGSGSTINRRFHITIGTHPSGDLSLEQELRLVKAALLYADRTTLYSLKSSVIMMVLRAGDFSPKHQLAFLETVIPYISTKDQSRSLSSGLEKYKRIIRIKHPSRQELLFRRQLENTISEQWGNFRAIALKIAAESHIESIERAVQSGLLDLPSFEGTDTNETVVEFMADCVAKASGSPLLPLRSPMMDSHDNKLIGEFVENVSGAVSDGSTYPLFDAQTSELISAGIRANKISVSESGISRGKQVGLAGHLLERLPLFEQATVDEILDIRKELDKPLIRFRKAMIESSESIKSASWDEDFPPEAEMVFHRDVRPAVLDLEEQVKSNSLLTSLLRKFADKPVILPAGSIFSVVMSNLSSLPQEIAFSLGIGVASAAIVYDAYNDWKQKKQVVEQNLLYFYYQSEKRLST